MVRYCLGVDIGDTFTVLVTPVTAAYDGSEDIERDRLKVSANRARNKGGRARTFESGFAGGGGGRVPARGRPDKELGRNYGKSC
jgi:hypothetical protein